METKSSSSRCCCIGNICKKMDSDSDCAKAGGVMVSRCHDCK